MKEITTTTTWSVWLDDLNPHINEACRVAPGESQRMLRGKDLYHVEAESEQQALDRARVKRAVARETATRGR